ncbi:spore germination protein (amino acid permease) [Paenibacillus sp. LBL]|uniref:GerAB/ArcD/ProY family transporter n=1 Tax=Paenibacillus TaxID=44249 RepID=UPI002474F1C8|nr:endospore germination permease [Paenibacillus sp. LBL]MDH6669363.1 spore germination protein (amino acid permease) [Paenibacillus sp. LBL]
MSVARGIPTNQVFMIMMLTAGLTNHVMIIPVLLEKSGRDAWITILLSAFLFMPWILLIYGIIKKIGDRTLTQALDESSGKWARIIVMGMSGLYFFSFSFYTLKEVIDWTKSTYMIQTPVIATALVLMLLCLVSVNHGIKTIGVSAGILLPFVVLLGIFVSIANLKVKNYNYLLPILEDGFMPILSGIPVMFGGLSQIFLILFLRPHLQKKPRFVTVLLIHLIFIFLTFGPTIGGIAEFGPEEMKLQRYPAYEQWRLVKLGKFVEHVDFFSIFQWLSGAYVSISICIYLLCEALLPKTKRRTGVLAISTLLIILCASPISNLKMYYAMADYFMPVSAVYLTVLCLLMFFLIHKQQQANSITAKGESQP